MAAYNLHCNTTRQNTSPGFILPGGCISPREKKEEEPKQEQTEPVAAQVTGFRGSIARISEKLSSPLAKTAVKVTACTAALVVGALAYYYAFYQQAYVENVKEELLRQANNFQHGRLFDTETQGSEFVNILQSDNSRASFTKNIDVCSPDPVNLYVEGNPFKNVNTSYWLKVGFDRSLSDQDLADEISRSYDSVKPMLGRIGFFMYGINDDTSSTLEIGICTQTPLQRILRSFA